MALQKCFSRRAALLSRNNEMRLARVLVTAATLLCDNAFGSRYFLDGSDEIRLFEACCGAMGRADEPSDTDRPNHRQCPFGSWNRVSNSLHGQSVWLSLESRSPRGLKNTFSFFPNGFRGPFGVLAAAARRRPGIDFSLLQQHKQALPIRAERAPSLHWGFTTCEPGPRKPSRVASTKVEYFMEEDSFYIA